jgi:hypothetical protein
LQGGATSDAVNLEHPERSPLLERATAGTMPPERDGRRLQPAELATLLQWLQAGAQWPKPVAIPVPPLAVGPQWEAQVLANSTCETNPPAAQVVYPLPQQHRGGGLRFRRKR